MAWPEWGDRVSIIAVGRWRYYPELPGARSLPQDYLPVGTVAEIAWLDVLRRKLPNTTRNQLTMSACKHKHEIPNQQITPANESNLTQGHAE